MGPHKIHAVRNNMPRNPLARGSFRMRLLVVKKSADLSRFGFFGNQNEKIVDKEIVYANV
jgi:hypothetical protein